MGALDAKDIYRQQPDAYVSIDDPTVGQLYSIPPFDIERRDIRIIGMAASCTWTGAPSEGAIYITMDGQLITYLCSGPVSGEIYFAKNGTEFPESEQTLVTEPPDTAFLREGKRIKIQAKITGGIVTNLWVRIKWAKRG